MAMVYIARPLAGYTGPSQVVLKVADEAYNDFLKYEIEMMRRLQHPGILRLLPIASLASTGTMQQMFNAKVEPYNPQSPYYIVMEYIRGGSLEHVIERAAPLAPAVAVHIALHIADALDYLHARNMVHLDLKPSNILLREPLHCWSATLPEVVISDFGIAQFVGGTRYTRTLGTTGYTAPESAAGGLPHPQNDIYALGVMLYRMVTGRMPFDGPVIPGVHLHPKFYPSRFNSAISPELERVILTAINTQQHQRYPSIGHLQHALNHLPEAHQPAGIKLPLIRGIPDGAVYGVSSAVFTLLLLLLLLFGLHTMQDQPTRGHGSTTYEATCVCGEPIFTTSHQRAHDMRPDTAMESHEIRV
jgi:serine/threonine protein kinase